MVVNVGPRNSSRTCPICRRRQYSRMGTELKCDCDWLMDGHTNASMNLLQTAISRGMAGGLRFSPGAFQHDAMMTLYAPSRGARSEPNGTSGIVGGTSRSPPDDATEPGGQTRIDEMDRLRSHAIGKVPQVTGRYTHHRPRMQSRL
jgi:hypothetical protein